MGSKTKIEWSDSTWTPIRARRRDTGKIGVHCERVSPACKNCYAATFNRRGLPAHGTGLDFVRENREKVEIFVDEDMLNRPIRWKRGRKIFVCSQTDLFGAHVADDEIAMVFSVMALAYWHTYQVLTKHPERMQWLLSSEDFWELVDCMMMVIIDGEVDPLNRTRHDLAATAPEVTPDIPLPNVWLGVTAENQEWADKRIPLLLQTPAAKRFVSVEPMLGHVNLRKYLWIGEEGGIDFSYTVRNLINWVICGGESGHCARPMHPDWVRSLRDQCTAAGVPFNFKQWGAWVPCGPDCKEKTCRVINLQGADVTHDMSLWGANPPMRKVKKKDAGRLLDGMEWNQFPGSSNA